MMCKRKIKYLQIIIFIFLVSFLISCQKLNKLENVATNDKSVIDINNLYDENLVTTRVTNLDNKYTNLYEQIMDMKMVSEYENDKNIEDFDTIFFGEKEQDGLLDNGNEDIEWILLYKDDEKALLQTKYIIDEMQYINILGQYNISEYLNKKYIYEIFDKNEINILKEINVEEPKDKYNTDDVGEYIRFYRLSNYLENRKISLIKYEDILKFYGNVSMVNYKGYFYNKNDEDIEESKIYNDKIVTSETNYVKKFVFNDNNRHSSEYYEFQNIENYKNIIVDGHHESLTGFYYLDSDLYEHHEFVPDFFIGGNVVSSDGLVNNNFYVFSDYSSLDDNSKYYLAGIRPIIYIDLLKARNFKLKSEYKKYKSMDIKKGKVLDIDNIKNVHMVSDYPDGTFLENIESVEFGSLENKYYGNKKIRLSG